MHVPQPITHDLSDARTAHGRVYDLELHDGDAWRPHGQLRIAPDAVAHNGEAVLDVGYHKPNHAILLHGTAADPTVQARLNLTENGSALVGTMSIGGGRPQGVRGLHASEVYRTRRHLAADPHAPFEDWDDLSISAAWVDGQLHITYRLGEEDISDRTRVTKVDRITGETTLEMVAEFAPPFRQNAFVILLAAGSRTFAGTYTDEDENDWTWQGQIPEEVDRSRAAAVQATQHSAQQAHAQGLTATATMSLQDLDNISSIQVVTDQDGKQITVDYAQTTCGSYFNKCLVNALDQEWIEGIYGHSYVVPERVKQVADRNSAFFKANSVLGTGQMLYDTLGTSEQYKDVIKRIDVTAMDTAWKDIGKSTSEGLDYQQASNDLYIEGFRDGVALMKPYLEDDPESWAKRYYDWLTDDANILTWQLQVASKQFDNVKTRIYEWYVKLQVLAPEKDYGSQMTTVAYAALLGVNYSKAGWSEDLKPFLQAVIENGVAGTVDPELMDDAQKRAVEANQELLEQLASGLDRAALLADGIAAALSAYQFKKSLQQIATDPEAQRLIGEQLTGSQYKAWSSLSASGKIGGILSTLFYGASAGFLLYSLVQEGKGEQTPKRVVREINLGILTLAMFVKGIEKLMSLGVGRFLQSFSAAGNGGAFRVFAGELATWFSAGGKVVPTGAAGKAFVAIFGENSTVFMARRIAPAMAVVGLVLSAFMLADAIKSGNVRSIVFEALNTFFALASVVLIGLQLMSVAWAGPVGLAVAVVGLVVALVALIWNWIDPTPAPPDPITRFVDGPMVAQRFANAT